jgi:transglutaminase-like putative cysteine protease
LKHPETGEKYAAGIFEYWGNFSAEKVEFDAEIYDVQFNFSKVTTIYPYIKNGLIYRTYTKQDGNLIVPDNTEIQKIGAELKQQSDNELSYAERAYEYVSKNMRYSLDFDSSDLTDILKRKNGDCGCFSSVYVSLLRYRGIPARTVYGINPKNQERKHAWSEFYLRGYGWVPVDTTAKNGNPGQNFFGYRPKEFVVTSCGNNITVLTSEYGKFGMKKIGWFQENYCWMWSDDQVFYVIILLDLK